MHQFTCKYDDLEVRSCDDSLLRRGEHTTAEVVQWEKGCHSCITIGYFIKTKEGFDFKFVGTRPISDGVDWKKLGFLIRLGYANLGENTDA